MKSAVFCPPSPALLGESFESCSRSYCVPACGDSLASGHALLTTRLLHEKRREDGWTGISDVQRIASANSGPALKFRSLDCTALAVGLPASDAPEEPSWF